MILAPILLCALAMAASYHFPWGIGIGERRPISAAYLFYGPLACAPVLAAVGVVVLPIRRIARGLLAAIWLPALLALMPLGMWAFTCHGLGWCEPAVPHNGIPANPLDPA